MAAVIDERGNVVDAGRGDSSVDTAPNGDGFTNTLAVAYSKATTTYNRLMAPIHELNEYVGKKNEFDAQFANGSLKESEYESSVKSLREDYFGDDINRMNVADKFEAVVDWKDAHGITDIQNSVGGVVTSIKDAFAQTGVGQKFAEIKEMAAEMSKEGATKQVASTPKKSSYESKVAQAAEVASSVQGFDADKELDSISAEATMS